MLFPKLAIHVSPFKLSHLANRGHLQFQNLRNTLNNINLGSTVAPNAPSVGSSASGGLGAASGPSTAGGAGGAKWSAGGRAGWSQQTQGRLITHANSAALDNQNSKQNDDDDTDEFLAHNLNNQSLYNKRNGTISSRWHQAQHNTVPPVTTLALSDASLQARYKSAFNGQCRTTTVTTNDQRTDRNIGSTQTTLASHSASIQSDHFDLSQRRRVISDARPSPSRRHSVSGHSLDLSAIPCRSRRLSTSDAHNGAEPRVYQSAHLHSRPYSSASTGSLELDQTSNTLPLPSLHSRVSQRNDVPRCLPIDRDTVTAITENHEDERWLKQSIHALSAPDHHYTSFYRLRSLLDSYVSSTPFPSVKVVDYMMWGFLITKPSFEPLHGLLRNYHYLLRNPKFKPSPNTYSTIITALCQRHMSNLQELELRKSKIDDAAVNQRLSQCLPNLSLRPIDSAHDLRVMNILTSEPNLDHAVQLFKTLSKENIRLLQPAALDALLQSCAIQSVQNPENLRGEPTAQLDLAVEVFGILKSQGSCSAQSYASLMDVFGYSQDLPNAKETFDDYRKVRTGLKSLLSPLLHQHHLRSPDLTEFSLDVDSSVGSPHTKFESRLADQASDAMVLLSLMRAYLVNADPISAVTLLEECLASGMIEASPIETLSPMGKVTSDHVLEIILGFVRLSDFRSASRWLKKLFNDEHALYDLDQPGKRITFLDKIVRSCCQLNSPGGGLEVANDAVKISIEKMNPLLNPNSSVSLLHRMRLVLNYYLVRALQHSALLRKDHQEAEKTVAIDVVKDSLAKSTDLICNFIIRRSLILETQPEASAALLDKHTFVAMEHLLNRVVQTCHHVRLAWVTGNTQQAKELTECSQNMLIKLSSHYSSIHHSHQAESDGFKVQHGSSSLAGLLTCYRSLIGSPLTSGHAKASDESIHSLQLQFALKITTPVIVNNMSLVLATQLLHLYSVCQHPSDLLQSINDWLIILTAGAILEVLVQKGISLPPLVHNLGSSKASVLNSLLHELDSSLVGEKVKLAGRNTAIDLQLLIQVIDRYNIALPVEGKLKSFVEELKSEGTLDSIKTSKLRLQRYEQEGSKYVANRFNILRGREILPNKILNSPQSTQLQSPVTTASTPSTTPSSLPSPPFSAHQSKYVEKLHCVSPPVQLPPLLFHGSSQSLLSSLPNPVVSVPHAPFQSFNENISQIALSMFCSKDLNELDRMYQRVHELATRGSYLTPDASSALIETFGRLGQIERMREMYVYAHVGLASIDGATQKDQISRSVSWMRVEDRMIIGLAYCGALDELAVHKLKLMNNGAAPSADAYAAMIQHARETTDDASVALACFEEAIQYRVPPNTFLCNTIISKLSKARRAPEALQVFDYMKQNNLVRNSVTFGAIINACCKTGDEKTAEILFKEMMMSKYYKPRVPPFNTMIQLYTQGVKPDREKVIFYFDEMVRQKIAPTDHTYNLLMQAYGLIEPYDQASMQDIFERACRDRNIRINGSHWSTLINVKGNIEKDLDGTLKLFDSISTHHSTIGPRVLRHTEPPALPDAVCYEALFNILLALNRTDLIPTYVQKMASGRVHMTAYVVNALIRAHASSENIQAARDLFETLVDPAPGQAAAFNHPIVVTPVKGSKSNAADRPGSLQKVVGNVEDPVFREPSSWETMIRAEVEHGNFERAKELISRMESRAYPNALLNRAKKLIESGNPATN